MTNIYQKQMNKLKLNAKQYAELTGMPYEVVKDILYNKEGDYSMEIKNLLRKNMMSKHQEIENDFDNAKFQAMELRKDVNYLEWYDKEYTLDLLKEKLQLNSIIQFEKNYYLKTNNKRASHWTYQVLVPKKEYEGHSIDKNKKLEFIKQLYDILVNGNKEKYLSTSTRKVEVKHQQKTSILKWIKNFDFKKYLKENDMSRTELANKCDINYTTLCHLISKRGKLTYETEVMKKVYNYVMGLDTKGDTKEEAILSNDLTNEELETLKEQPQVITTHQEQEIKVISANDDIMRKILISRLTDEEKALIELFGGKIC